MESLRVRLGHRAFNAASAWASSLACQWRRRGARPDEILRSSGQGQPDPPTPPLPPNHPTLKPPQSSETSPYQPQTQTHAQTLTLAPLSRLRHPRSLSRPQPCQPQPHSLAAFDFRALPPRPVLGPLFARAQATRLGVSGSLD